MSESNVVILPVSTVLDHTPERVLTEAIAADLEVALVVGMDKQGNPYIAGSTGYKPDVLWHLEQAKKLILSME